MSLSSNLTFPAPFFVPMEHVSVYVTTALTPRCKAAVDSYLPTLSACSIDTSGSYNAFLASLLNLPIQLCTNPVCLNQTISFYDRVADSCTKPQDLKGTIKITFGDVTLEQSITVSVSSLKMPPISQQQILASPICTVKDPSGALCASTILVPLQTCTLAKTCSLQDLKFVCQDCFKSLTTAVLSNSTGTLTTLEQQTFQTVLDITSKVCPAISKAKMTRRQIGFKQ